MHCQWTCINFNWVDITDSHLSEQSNIGQQERCNPNQLADCRRDLDVVGIVADGQQGTNAASDPDERESDGESPNLAPGPPASPLPYEKRSQEDAWKYGELEDSYAITVGHGAHCNVKEDDEARF